MSLPTGTITFLRSDIVGSMALARELGARYDELNAEHATLVRAAVATHGGEVVRTEGDAFFVVFTEADRAARAAVDIQRALAHHSWPEGEAVTVRIGLHSGSAVRAGDDYGGFEVSRAARIAAVGHGGQIVLSDPTRALISADLPEGWRIAELGRVRLKDLAEPERLFGLLAPGLATDFEPLRSESIRAEHLPQRLASFIGREAELAELEQLLADNRLLTLVGPGGTGKTTLALELARRHAADYADGAWFVDLQEVREPEAVKPAIAHALGLLDGASGAAADRLDDYLADRECLLVIDNFEQVVEAADVTSGLLAASSASRCLVTSRTPLRLSEEQEYPVWPLSTAGDDDSGVGEAGRLFIERVRRTRPNDTLDDELEHVRAICALLDGLPLAIELTAARAAVLPIPVIRQRLEARLPLPGDGARDLPDRQRTMERAVAWSHELLDGPLRRLLARASVFESSFELEQAELVCGPADDLGIEVLDGLFELARQSLLVRIEDRVGGVRFRMLETIRTFADARLRESDDEAVARVAHAQAYATLSRRELGEPMTPGRQRSLDRLEADIANLRAAIRYAISQELVEPALALVADWRFWLGAGLLQEALGWTRAALDLPRADEQPEARGMALDACGSLYWWNGDIPAAHALYEEQLLVAEQSGDEMQRARALFNLAHSRNLTGDAAGAVAAMEEAERIFRERGEERWLVRLAVARSFAASDDHMSPERIPVLQGIVERLETLDDSWAQGTALTARAQIELMQGNMPAALGYITASYRLALRLREHADMVVSLVPTAMALLRAGFPEDAARIFGAATGAAERVGIQSPIGIAPLTGGQDPNELLDSELGAERCRVLLAEGRRMSLEDAVVLLESIERELRR